MLASEPRSRPTWRDDERGTSIIEIMVAMLIALVVVLATYDFIDAARRIYISQSERVQAQATGRATLDLFETSARQAGYNPPGRWLPAVTDDSTATRVRFLADLDGDGCVRVDDDGSNRVVNGNNQTCDITTETDERIAYIFNPVGGDVYELQRGVDYDDDWTFGNTGGETLDVIGEDIVQIDYDDDGTLDDFIQYDYSSPATSVRPRSVTVTYGVRTSRTDPTKRPLDYVIVPFRSEITLRNVN